MRPPLFDPAEGGGAHSSIIMKSPRRVNTLKTIAHCKTELEWLEAGGGVRRNGNNKLTPLSQKARHIVERMFEIAGRHNPEVWSILADEADWNTRVKSVARAAEVFGTPMQYRVPVRSSYGGPVNRGAGRGERQADQLTQRRRAPAGR